MEGVRAFGSAVAPSVRGLVASIARPSRMVVQRREEQRHIRRTGTSQIWRREPAACQIRGALSGRYRPGVTILPDTMPLRHIAAIYPKRRGRAQARQHAWKFQPDAAQRLIAPCRSDTRG